MNGKYNVIIVLSNGMRFESIFNGKDTIDKIYDWYTLLEHGYQCTLQDINVEPYE